LADGGDGGEASVAIREDYDAPAPSVTVVPPLSTMTCIRGFGVGASTQDGAIALGPTWRDRDCQSAELFRALSSIGLYVPAAVALCSRERHWFPFGSRDACEAQVAQALIDAATPQENVRVVYWPEDSACRESLKRCEETVTK